MPRPWIDGELCWYAMDVDERENTVITGHPPGQLSGNGFCTEIATVAIELSDDIAPGPRKMCARHALLWIGTEL